MSESENWYEWRSEYIRMKILLRTNIRIYSYPKNDTNEYPNIYSDQKYSNTRIFEYIRHTLNCTTIFKLFKPTVRKVVKRLVVVALIDLCYVSHCWFEPHEPRHWVTSMQRLKAKTHLTINSKCGRQPSLQNLFHILD